ncbi:MAG: MerR family transcriptional regulator [Propionibacteriaceae bacterium]|nr:MerR family transcriptional regulator [Propionibacteriaceae bacterium]
MADLQPFDADAPAFTVAVAARLADLHPQTLRTYDRLGLVVPRRARGRGRRYSLRDIARLRHVQHLSQSEGINLEGIRRILALETELDAAREQIARLTETLQRVYDEPPASRLFTADPGGGVYLGRTRRRAQLALPAS